MVDDCAYCVLGIMDYCNRYGDTINRVLSGMGPPPSMSSNTETVRRISDALAERIPMDQLSYRRQWRIDRLIDLAKVKKHLDGQ